MAARRRVVMTALATLAVASAAGPRAMRQSPLFVRGGRTTQAASASASAARRTAPASTSQHADDVERDAAVADDASASAKGAPVALSEPLAVRRRRALMAGLPTGGGPEGRSLAPIIAISFLYFMTIATTAPALPTFCNQLKSATGGTDVNVAGNSLYGTMTAIDQFFTFCFVGIWGTVADHFGRKPIAVVSSLGLGLGWLTVAYAGSFSPSMLLPLLYAGRALDGITSCMQPITQSMVTDVSPAGSLLQNLGTLQGLSIGCAFIMGGMFGGVLTQKAGPAVVFKVASGIALFSALFGAFVLPESLPKERRNPKLNLMEANPLSNLSMLTKSRRSIGAAILFLMFWSGLNCLQINLFNYTQYRYSWTKVQTIGTQAISGLLLAISSALGPRLLLPKLGPKKLVRICVAGFAACLVGMGLAPTGQMFSLSVMCGSMFTMALPVCMGLIAGKAEGDEAGATLSALEAMNTLNRVFGYKAMTSIFGWGISDGRDIPGASFVVAAGLVALGGIAFEAMVDEE